MKKFLFENWFKIVIIIGAIFVVYRYDFYPKHARIQCMNVSLKYVNEISGDQTDERYFFWKCMHQFGFSD